MRRNAAHLFQIGHALGPYRIEGLLGCGGMGRVYLARDTRLDRTVAIKVVDPSRQPAAALVREARLAASLDHPAICSVHEIGHLGAEPFIVMEHVRGTALATLIRNRRSMPQDAAISYALQIADAVVHAHEHGVVHGDIKTSNVMVGPDGRVKVLDFGLAVRRTIDDPLSGSAETTCPSPSSGCAGTVPYMAPELLRGRPPHEASDIWALGVVLYEMVAGCRPFRGATTYELAANILGNNRGPVPARVPMPVREVIERCLSGPPADRYRSARELMTALHPLAGAAIGGAVENHASAAV